MQHIRILALSPHSDDVALSLGAYLLDKCAASYIRLVTVFSISKSTTDDRIQNTAAVTSIRKAEDVAFVNALSSAAEVKWLDRKDAPLRLCIPDEAVFACDLSDADRGEIQHIVSIVKEGCGDFDLTLAPMGLGGHIDHVIVRNAALELLKEGASIVFYEDIPYAADLSLTKIGECAKQLASISGQKMDLFSIKTSVTLEKKIALLSCYHSQMDPRTESRIISHSGRLSELSIVERVWASPNVFTATQHLL